MLCLWLMKNEPADCGLKPQDEVSHCSCKLSLHAVWYSNDGLYFLIKVTGFFVSSYFLWYDICIHVCESICVHVEVKGWYRGHLLLFSTLCLSQCSSLGLETTNWLDWLTRKPSVSSYFCVLSAGVTDVCGHSWLLHGSWRPEVGPHAYVASIITIETPPALIFL